MAATKFLVYFSGQHENPVVSGAARLTMARLRNVCKRIASGNYTAAQTVDARHTLVAASGTITMATSSGTVGAVINGVTITVTWGTSDTASSTALAAAINASSNALVANHVTASAAAGVTTITAVLPGRTGNTITLAATGTNVTASAARLTGGSDTRVTFSL